MLSQVVSKPGAKDEPDQSVNQGQGSKSKDGIDDAGDLNIPDFGMLLNSINDDDDNKEDKTINNKVFSFCPKPFIT